ncbi:hypothetical protein, partial [Staphylococcus aureus]|uniref:hypothetical protein n=1 Tax=Staphylococcus aureus TaxID=1280 RepID=UPI0039BEC1B6
KQEEDANIKASTIISGEIVSIKKYFETISPLIAESEMVNKETILYDMKKIMMTNSLSAMEGILKKNIKLLYEKSSTTTKGKIYKTILPITKKMGIFVLPPWYFTIREGIKKTTEIVKVLFFPQASSKKLQQQKEKI